MQTQLQPNELRLAERVAKRLASKWSAVESDDLTSHLYLWLVQNQQIVTRWRGEEGGEGKLYVSLRREAAKFCAKEQAVRVGRPISSTVSFYNFDRVSKALPFIFEDTPETVVSINPVTNAPVDVPAEHGVAMTILADVRGAFWGLNREQREVLEWRYRDGLAYEEIGELRNITKDGAKKQCDRAVQRIVDALSGD